MDKVTRPLLRYFGGKWILAPWIISNFPPHRVYVEPFGGAGSVLLRKPRAYAEVYNDIDQDVVNLFRVLRDKDDSQELHRRLVLTPFSREEFNSAYADPSDDIERARFLVIRSFMGFGSNGHTLVKTGFRANSNRSGTTPAHDWANWSDVITAITHRLSGVVIENKDFEFVMRDSDSTDTLHYIDPPYVLETRSNKGRYTHELDNAGHERLCSVIKELKGMVLLSGYEHDVYKRLGWKSISRKALADGARERTEVLWLNERAWVSQNQMSFNV